MIAAESARVRVELEVAGPDGKYPTTLADYIEAAPKPLPTDASAFVASEAASDFEADKAKRLLDALSAELARLPRISREFFAFLVSRKEEDTATGATYFRVNADLIARVSRYPDSKGELRFLSDRRFIDYDPAQEFGQSDYWSIRLPGTTNRTFYEAFFAFLEEKNASAKSVFVDLDFSVFGTAGKSED